MRPSRCVCSLRPTGGLMFFSVFFSVRNKDSWLSDWPATNKFFVEWSEEVETIVVFLKLSLSMSILLMTERGMVVRTIRRLKYKKNESHHQFTEGWVGLVLQNNNCTRTESELFFAKFYTKSFSTEWLISCNFEVGSWIRWFIKVLEWKV